jgi:hypothetical protein
METRRGAGTSAFTVAHALPFTIDGKSSRFLLLVVDETAGHCHSGGGACFQLDLWGTLDWVERPLSHMRGTTMASGAGQLRRTSALAVGPTHAESTEKRGVQGTEAEDSDLSGTARSQRIWPANDFSSLKIRNFGCAIEDSAQSARYYLCKHASKIISNLIDLCTYGAAIDMPQLF